MCPCASPNPATDREMVEDGREGIELYRSEQPDLVIADIIMPEVEGLETIRKIREMQPMARIIAICAVSN